MVSGDGVPGPPDSHSGGAPDPPVLQGQADEALTVLQDECGDAGTAGERLGRATDDDGHRVAGAVLGQQVPDGAAGHRAQPCSGTDHWCCGTASPCSARGPSEGPARDPAWWDHARDSARDSARAPPAAAELPEWWGPEEQAGCRQSTAPAPGEHRGHQTRVSHRCDGGTPQGSLPISWISR